MSNLFRNCNSGRIHLSSMIQQHDTGTSQDIANEFWTLSINPSKKISLTLKNAAGNLVASTLVKYAIFEYKSGSPYNYHWMDITKKGYLTTTAAGLFETLYTGSAGVGDTAYVMIMHPSAAPTESFIWSVIVQ